MGWFIRFGLLRLRAQWRSLLTLIVGVILAAIIGANASLYTTAISQVGLVQFLSIQSSADTNILARFSIAPFDTQGDFAPIWSTFDEQVNSASNITFADLTAWSDDVINYAETQALIPIKNEEDIPNARLRIAYYQGLFEQIELVEGTLPQASINPNIQAEVLINAEAAVLMDIAVGDTLQLDQRGWDTSQIFTVQVVGLILPLDATNSYWFDPSPLRVDTGSRIETNLLTTRAILETIPAEFIPQTTVQIGWRINPNYSQLPYNQVEQAANQVDELTIALNNIFLADEDATGNYFYTTNIPELMRTYDEQIVFLNIPFGLLLLQLAALVLFFLILIAALVRRGERREIAMFQSRGATDAQVIAARSIESIVICIGATLIAPILAQLLLQQFIPVLTGIRQIPLELTPQVFLYSGLASLLAFIALTLTLYPVLRQPLISSGGIGIRGDNQTIWQRYYLDVVLLIVGIGALYQLTQSQSVVANNISDSTQVDPLLLIAPTLLFVAFSSVLLRFFPFVMSLIARFYANQNGIEGALASWQVSRQPLHYGRIAFLLALAIGIGWFAVSYQATIIGNQTDQSSYLVGGDVRLIYANPESSEVATSMSRIAALADVQASTQVTRYELPSVIATSGSGRRSRQAGDLLAIHPATFAEVVSWRNDLGDLSLPVNDFDTDTIIGTPIPADTVRIGFWAQAVTNAYFRFGVINTDLAPYPPVLLQDRLFNFRLQDQNNNFYLLPAIADSQPVADRIDELIAETGEEFLWQAVDTDDDGQPDFVPRYDWTNDGWVYFEIDLTEYDIQGQASLFSIDVLSFNNSFFSEIELNIGAVQFINAAGELTTLDYSTQIIDILGVQNQIQPSQLDQVTVSDPIVPHGNPILRTSFAVENAFNAPSIVYAMMFNYPELSSVSTNTAPANQTPEEATIAEESIIGLPVLVSQSISELNEFTIGQNFNLVISNVSPWFTVDRIVDYYPTLFQDRPYIITDADLFNFTLRRAVGEGLSPNELWLRLKPNVDEAQFLSDLRLSDDITLIADIISFEDVINTFETDVLSLGVIGLLFISFIIGLALSVVSLFTYISLTVQARIGEFAVLRALGMTTTRLIMSIIIEQAIVLIAAIILGAIIGQFLSVQVLPPLALSAAGGVVTPPFVLTIDWLAIIQYLIAMVVILCLVLVVTAISIRRTATADSLRLSEE